MATYVISFKVIVTKCFIFWAFSSNFELESKTTCILRKSCYSYILTGFSGTTVLF